MRGCADAAIALAHNQRLLVAVSGGFPPNQIAAGFAAIVDGNWELLCDHR